MNINELKEQCRAEIKPVTDADLRAEYRFILAQQMTEKLRQEGLISREEFDRIMEKNRETFSPRSAGIDAN